MRRRSLLVFIFTLLLLVLLNSLAVTNAQPPFLTSTWQAVFFNSTNFTNQVASTTYSSLNFNWAGTPLLATGQPVPGVQADNFSARFTKTVTLQAGDYNYTMTADDTAILRSVSTNTTIINIATPNTTQSATIRITAPTSLTLQVDFVDFTGTALLNLVEPTSGTGQPPFTTPGITLTPTPSPLPTRTALPPIPPGAITATVIRAGVLNVRDAPSLGGNRLGRILRGETYAIVGRDADARWFLLQLSGYQAWAYGYYVFVDGNEFTPPIVSGNSVLGLAGQQDFGVRGQTNAILRLRAQPNVASTQTGRITWGAFLPIVGRTADGYWYQVVWKNTLGWAYASYIDIREGDLNNVPIK